MGYLLNKLWADDNGFIISAELVLVGTIVGLGMVVGLAELSSAVNNELSDVAQGFAACNQYGEDSDWDDYSVWDSDPSHEQSGDDFGGGY